MEEMDWKEKRELNEEFTDLLCDFADAFNDLKDALAEMERINEFIFKSDVEHDDWLRELQKNVYSKNYNLIARIKEAINE